MFKYAKLFLAVLLLVGCTKEPEPRPTTPLIVKPAPATSVFR